MQAYVAVQTFVERCLMNLEAPNVVVDLTHDDTWSEWSWMNRYRVWEANREVFLYPENWLVESQRPNRTEIYKSFEQEVQQGQSTADYLESVVLNFVSRLDDLAHLFVTGTCTDQATGDIHVVARTLADPPTFYHRTYSVGAWSGWTKIPLDIKAHQVVPAMYRRRLCLFWLDLKIFNEPQQPLTAPQQSTSPPGQIADRYVALGMHFSTFSNGTWQPIQASKGTLFDKPFYLTTAAANLTTTEALYTIKVQSPTPTPGYGSNLFIDVFRLGYFDAFGVSLEGGPFSWSVYEVDNTIAVHVGRAVFDGRFSELELRDLVVPNQLSIMSGNTANGVRILSWAQSTYGPDAQPLLPLADAAADPNLQSDSQLAPQAGALVSPAGSAQSLSLNFTAAGSLEQNAGPLLMKASLPLRVVGPDNDVNFDPASYFFYQDSRRCYWVESQNFWWTGSFWSPAVPSDPASAPYELRYMFHPFYHPFTRLLWHELASGGFDALYDVRLQLNPDQVDPSGADVFSFGSGYQPVVPRVWWDHDDVTAQDRQFLDYRPGAAYGVYNWELFYHVPMYVAQLLSQNLQFEDALVFLEDFDAYGFDLLLFMFADGTEGELALGREGGFQHIHGGPHVVLLDKRGILAGTIFPQQHPLPAQQVERLRGLLNWFWHDVSHHFLTPLARGQLWTAVGALEDLRRTCVDLARLAADFTTAAEGYEQVERAIAADRLVTLAATFCPPERVALLQAAHAIVGFYREVAPPLAQAHGITYPAALEGVICARLDALDDTSSA